MFTRYLFSTVLTLSMAMPQAHADAVTDAASAAQNVDCLSGYYPDDGSDPTPEQQAAQGLIQKQFDKCGASCLNQAFCDGDLSNALNKLTDAGTSVICCQTSGANTGVDTSGINDNLVGQIDNAGNGNSGDNTDTQSSGGPRRHSRASNSGMDNFFANAVLPFAVGAICGFVGGQILNSMQNGGMGMGGPSMLGMRSPGSMFAPRIIRASNGQILLPGMGGASQTPFSPGYGAGAFGGAGGYYPNVGGGSGVGAGAGGYFSGSGFPSYIYNGPGPAYSPPPNIIGPI